MNPDQPSTQCGICGGPHDAAEHVDPEISTTSSEPTGVESEPSPEALEAWEREKNAGLYWALQKGRALGIPQEYLDRFIQVVLSKETEARNFGTVYRLMKNLHLGTDEETMAVGERANQQLFD